MSEYYFEIKRNQMEGMNNVSRVYQELSQELSNLIQAESMPLLTLIGLTMRPLGDNYVFSHRVVKDVVDSLRERGIKAGCLRAPSAPSLRGAGGFGKG